MQSFVLLILLLPPVVEARSGVVTGSMVLESGEPALGGAVVLAGTRYGSAVDSAGRFIISDVPPGEYSLEGRLVGYEQKSVATLDVRGGDTLRVRLELWENPVELSQIEVSGERRQRAEDVRPSVTTLTPRESKVLPGAAEDVLRSLQALPGVTSVSDYSSQLVVRGSGPDQNLITIDGFEVLNPYRLYGFVSMFNPETITSISLQTGGFGAEYGDRLSAVLDVRNREGRTDVPVSGKLNTSLTNLNGIFEGGLGGASYLISVRRTYYDLILGPILKSAKLVQGDVALPNFRDLQVKLASPVSDKSKILLNLFTSRDGVDLVSGADRSTPDSVNLFDNSYNTLVGATWQFAPSPELVTTTQLSWYRNTGEGFFDGTFVDPAQNTGDVGRTDTLGLRYVNFGVRYDYRYQKVTLSQRGITSAGNHTLEAGYGIDWLRTDFTRTFRVDETLQEIIRSRGQVVPTDAVVTNAYNKYHLFLQDRLPLAPGLFLQAGLRLDMYPMLARTAYISPRLNLSFTLDDLSTLRAAYGIYYQSPGLEKEDLRTRIVFSEQSLSLIGAERADHYILGIDRMVTPEWQAKVEAYYKKFSDVIAPGKVQGLHWETQRVGANPFSPSSWTTPTLVPGDSLTNRPVNEGSGASYGCELMLQKIRSAPGERFSGWVSYALSYADRERDGITTPFLFDQRHAVNVVGNYRLGERWEIGAKFTLRSGRPFVRAVGVTPRVGRTPGGEVPVVQVDSHGKVILDVAYEQERNSGRLSLYHSLDIRITTYPRWWGLNWSAYLDVQNVYNRENQQQMRYYIDQDGNIRERDIKGIPIFPSLGMSVTF